MDPGLSCHNIPISSRACFCRAHLLQPDGGKAQQQRGSVYGSSAGTAEHCGSVLCAVTDIRTQMSAPKEKKCCQTPRFLSEHFSNKLFLHAEKDP